MHVTFGNWLRGCDTLTLQPETDFERLSLEGLVKLPCVVGMGRHGVTMKLLHVEVALGDAEAANPQRPSDDLVEVEIGKYKLVSHAGDHEPGPNPNG